MSIRTFVALAALLLSVRCNDEQDAVAAGVPQLELRGEIAAADTAAAIAPMDGRVASLAVQEGAAVQAGGVIATLTNASVERDLAYTRVQVALAEQRLRAKPPANNARKKAAASILANREAKRNRYRALYQTHDISKQELEDAENEYTAAWRDWLAEKEAPAIDTSLLQLELEKARTEQAMVVDRQTQLTVLAPMSGTVTRVAVRAGESVFPRDTIAEITDNTKARVRAAIAPELMRYVRNGMPLQVKVFTVPPRNFTAPVRAIVPAASGATLLIDLPNPDGVLQPGQQAMVTVK
ncbi:MAG TPA: efflux RND transporter periplasmic adaptor subunit [Thermoanaerobaculia bacterium]|nr:efflux RND transporter periplasmic adaptor subunit [Thermoanaerobaculia bacterium]